MVASESDILGEEELSKYLHSESEKQGSLIYTGIMPLKQAKAELETALAQQAYEMSGSTYEAAKLLEVNQSTVVRILQKARARKDLK